MTTTNRNKAKPEKVPWDAVVFLSLIATFSIGLLSFFAYVLYNIDWSYYIPIVINILLSKEELNYFFRIPLATPLVIFIWALSHHLYYKFYGVGFFTPIKNVFSNIFSKIGMAFSEIGVFISRLVMSIKIRYNTWRSRRRTLQAVKKQKIEEYEKLLILTKLQDNINGEEDKDYERLQSYIRQNRTEPVVEESNS